jgi:hypothetical protein
MKVSRRSAGFATALAVATGAVAVAVHRYAKRERAERLRAIDVAAVCREALPLGAACGPCIAISCCEELSACWGWNDCIDLNDCWVKAGEDEGQGGDLRSRAAACERAHSGARAVFHAWDDCARKRCEDECPRGPEEDE